MKNMTEDPRELHRRAGAMAEGVIARIAPERLADPTPCTEWDVRGVINHMVGGNLRFAAQLTGEPGPERGDDVLGDDPLTAFRDSMHRLCAAFDRDGLLEETVQTPFGPGPGAMLVTMRASDLTVHSWDLAAATGQPRDLDPDLIGFVDAAFRVRPIPRGGDSPFGAAQPISDDAPAADRLAAFVGRTVPS